MSVHKEISLSEFIKAKTELRDCIRDAIIMFTDDFYRKTGVHAEGAIEFQPQYYEEFEDCSTKYLGMTVEVSLTTDVEYDD